MAQENSTHFQFRLGGIELEISGERSFVEGMYRRIMKDIEAARTSVVSEVSGAENARLAELTQRERKILWVHRCSEMMHKIYMSSPAELDESPLMRPFETMAIGVVYAEDHLVEQLLPDTDRPETLWAELTEAGRQKIATANPDPASDDPTVVDQPIPEEATMVSGTVGGDDVSDDEPTQIYEK